VTATLCAVVLNPPSTNGSRTNRCLRLAADIIGCRHLVIVNLFSRPTPSLTEINMIGTARDGWLDARDDIDKGLERSQAVLAAWGVGGLTGSARVNQFEQIQWLTGRLARFGHDEIWTLNGETRHPSRWHQYVSDKHGRTEGGVLRDRLGQVLRQEAVGHLFPVTPICR
jgi:hypothetical protein